MGNTDDDRKKPKKRFWTKVEHESDSGPEGAAWHQPSISRRGARYKNSAGSVRPGIRESEPLMVCRKKVSRLGFAGLNFQIGRAREEEEEEEGEEKKKGEEGCSQRSSDWPMAASVDPEIHKNL